MNYGNILKALNAIKDGNIPLPNSGICGNLEFVYDDMFKSSSAPTRFIKECFISLFGEEILFPVEGDVISFIENKHKWDKETDMGLRRFDLLDKMIAYAEEQLNKEEA